MFKLLLRTSPGDQVSSEDISVFVSVLTLHIYILEVPQALPFQLSMGVGRGI